MKLNTEQKRIRDLQRELQKLAHRVLAYVPSPEPDLERYLDADIELRKMANAALALVEKREKEGQS